MALPALQMPGEAEEAPAVALDVGAETWCKEILMNKKRVVVVADFHSGHLFGLTPPGWWIRGSKSNVRASKIHDFQRHLWGFYEKAINELKPIDTLLVCGDAIDGKGERSGGIEQLTTNRHEQALMAASAIDIAEAKKVRLFRGTRYHTGRDEDFEDTIVQSAKCQDVAIGDHDWFECNGQTLDVRHKVGSSSIPHGRHTPVARERLWNLIWNSDDERQPKATIIIRAHVHFYGYCGGPDWLGVTCPALCYNSSFGKRDCSGLVDIGLLVFDFNDDGTFSWYPILADFPAMKVHSEKL